MSVGALCRRRHTLPRVSVHVSYVPVARRLVRRPPRRPGKRRGTIVAGAWSVRSGDVARTVCGGGGGRASRCRHFVRCARREKFKEKKKKGGKRKNFEFFQYVSIPSIFFSSSSSSTYSPHSAQIVYPTRSRARVRSTHYTIYLRVCVCAYNHTHIYSVYNIVCNIVITPQRCPPPPFTMTSRSRFYTYSAQIPNEKTALYRAFILPKRKPYTFGPHAYTSGFKLIIMTTL